MRDQDTREAEIRAQRAARRKVNERKRRQRKMKRIFNFFKLLIFISIIGIVLVIFVFKTPVEKGTALLKTGEYEEAIVEFTNGLDDLDYIAESYKGIGMAYYELGQYIDAAENLEIAIQKGETDLGTTYYILAVSYMQMEEYESALNNIVIALTKSGNSDELVKELRFNEILCMEKTSDWVGAKAKATSYLEVYPDDEKMQKELEFLITR